MSKRSYYKRKMKEYKKARDKLGDYEKDISQYLESCTTQFDNFSSVYEGAYNLQGEVMDHFYAKSEDFSDSVKQLFSKIDNDINIIINEKNKADDLYEKYKRLYEDSDEDDD